MMYLILDVVPHFLLGCLIGYTIVLIIDVYVGRW
jgi:hypothetical protein